MKELEKMSAELHKAYNFRGQLLEDRTDSYTLSSLENVKNKIKAFDKSIQSVKIVYGFEGESIKLYTKEYSEIMGDINALN